MDYYLRLKILHFHTAVCSYCVCEVGVVQSYARINVRSPNSMYRNIFFLFELVPNNNYVLSCCTRL